MLDARVQDEQVVFDKQDAQLMTPHGVQSPVAVLPQKPVKQKEQKKKMQGAG